MEPLARVELSSHAPAEVIRLLPLVGLEPVSRIGATSPSGSNLADASLPIRVDFAPAHADAVGTIDTGKDRGAPAPIAIAFDSIPPLGADLTADLVTDSPVAAVCFILSRILGLAAPFLTTDADLFDVIRAAIALARGPARILVEGELGVGKESLIKLIHAAGRGPSGSAASRERPGLVHAECAGLEANAVEGEIAPLLAQVAEFNRSDSGNGAIFFNRIGELPPAAQRKLLDLLCTFAGAASDRRDLSSHVRILAASTRPLRAMVAEGILLPEFYDLFDATLTISPLRVRRGDLPLLVRHYLRSLNSSRTLNAAALRALSVYPFPGNALELVNFVTRIAIIPPKAVPRRPPFGACASGIVGRAEVISRLECGSLNRVRRLRRPRDYRLNRTRRKFSAPPVEPRDDPAMLELAPPASLRLTTGTVPRLRRPRGGHHRPPA